MGAVHCSLTELPTISVLPHAATHPQLAELCLPMAGLPILSPGLTAHLAAVLPPPLAAPHPWLCIHLLLSSTKDRTPSHALCLAAAEAVLPFMWGPSVHTESSARAFFVSQKITCPNGAGGTPSA